MRVLCLGNELLADDALGLLVAEELHQRYPQLEVVFTTVSGLGLMDYLSDTELLVVVDSIQTGTAPAGTVQELRVSDIQSPSGPSPHYLGLLETLQLARELLLNVPKEIVILAVEAADCLTLGGTMHEAVKGSVGVVANRVAELMHASQA